MEHMERWVQETFAPLVLTCTTPEVERIAQKNGLAFAELLNAFSMIAQADAPLRSVSHQFTLAGFNFKFVASTQFGTLALQDASRLLNEEIARHPPRSASGRQSTIDLDIPKIVSVDDVPVYLRAIGVASDSTASAPNTDPLPWYREFKRTLLDTFRCEEYSMLCQPAAMLLAVSSTDGNPRHCFEELAAVRNLPPAFLNGLYDPNIPKFYVVVHDNAEADGTSIDPEAILLSLQLPPQASTVLRLNSFATERPDAREHARRWTEHPYVRRPLFTNSVSNDILAPEYVGSMLSNDDVLRMTAFVRDVGLRFVLAALEARIFQLNEIVSAMKKGVKNVFKSWLRKPKDLSMRASSSSASVTYRCDSIEAQTRLLGDTAFMVRDYDLALQMYRLVRDDYKSDKSTLHCANANEMIALCLLLTRGSPMQMTNALESATAIYVKGNSLVTARLAVRAAVVAGEIYNTLSHSGLFTDYMDSASAALIRGSTMEQGICSAVLMERAALCDIQSRQPKFRKYGFRMVMAGHVYDSLGHRAHSARCYALARAIYDASGWFQVEDHINFTLAQQANRLSDPIASINLFLKLIGTGRNSASQQEALLYEFGLIVKEFLATSNSGDSASVPATLSRNGPMLLTDKALGTKTLVVKNLVMPELEDSSTVVFAPGNACGINRDIDGNTTDTEHWRALEQAIAKQNQIHQFATSDSGADASRESNSANRWLHQPSTFNVTFRNKKQQVKKPENYALGEPIYVEFVMKNALSCAVDVEDIHLFGKFEPAPGTATAATNAVIDVPEPRPHDNSDNSEAVRITVGRVNLQLLPCSEERVRLAVTPHVRGVLRLIGVRWSICGGDVHGEHAFDIPGPLLQDTRANREARARAPNTSLIANVIGAMPWLGVQVENAPTEAYVGEIVKMDVTLVNGGSAELADLQLCCSDLLLCVASDSRAASTQFVSYIGASGHVLDLSDVKLAPGESKRIAVWARGVMPGRLRARLVFRYRNASGDDAAATSMLLPHRTVRIALDLNLLPCVSVSYAVAPSYGSSGEYILGVTVQNDRRDGEQHDPVRLEQLLCVSRAWTIERFPSAHGADSGRPDPVRDSAQLGFQEASTSYFRIVPRTAAPPTTTDDADSVSGSTSALDLAPASVSDATDQLSNLPIEQFLCIENAQTLVRDALQAGADGNGSGADGKRNGGGGFRTIQSVRRENKALKSQQTEEQAADDEEARRRASPQPTSRAALLSSLDVDGHLVLVWSTETSVRRRVIGQANVTPIKVRAPLRPNACPLNVTLEYADSIALQPATSVPGVSFAELDIVMTIRNDCAMTSAPIDCTLEMLHPSEGKASSSYPFAGVSASAASPHFFWAGVTKKTMLDLAPNAHETIKLRACFLSAGIYDLNRFRFRIHARQATGSSAKALAPSVIELPVEYLVYVKPAPSSVTPSGSADATHSLQELAA